MQNIVGRFGRLSARASAIALSALILASCGGSDNVETPPLFSTTVVLGSSLSDTGNACPAAAPPLCPPTPPYAPGRISNGTLYIETVAARYGAAVAPSTRGGNNFAYAYGRTGVIPGGVAPGPFPHMGQQLDAYLTRQASLGTISDRTLIVVEAGGAFANNVFNGLPAIQSGTITSTQFITAAITDVVTIMTRLYSAGARNILLINAPNLGLTPALRAQGPQVAGAATQLAGAFNQTLAAQATGLAAASPGLRIYSFDAFALFNEVAANPAGFGFTNVTDPCVGTTGTVCATPATFAFWDGVHPTQAFGAVAASRINAVLPPPQ
jgi:phospholipase/lecithinase/hemolysin